MNAQVSDLLRDLTTALPTLLGRNLVGIYLYGSLTQAAFDPKRSDVDCIVVTRRDLSDRQLQRLRRWLARAAQANPWVARLQMHLLIRDHLLTKKGRGCLYQFGRLTRSGSDGNPIIWMNVLASGEVLLGPRPRSFVPPITPEILFQALVREVGYLRDEISDKRNSKWRDVPSYRAYAVLTLCRILYSFRHGTVVSKPKAASWALKHLPRACHPVIRHALAADGGSSRRRIPLARLRRFIDFSDARLHGR